MLRLRVAMDGWVDGWVDTAQCNAITVDAIVEEQMEEEETLQWDSGFSFPLNFIIVIFFWRREAILTSPNPTFREWYGRS